MIKIFDSNDTDFSTAGNIIINPLKCIETRKKSLNGWYIDVEIPIKYAEYIEQDKLCVVKSKSKLIPQAFRIKNIEKRQRKIVFQARHVMFDAEDYFLLDVRPTNQNGQNALSYINQRTDKASPFTVFSNITVQDTAYFIRKNMLEAWTTIEERWGGVFDADNWNIRFLTKLGNDNGETVMYGKNLQGIEVYEDWSSVVTKLYPVGYNGLMLPEVFLESDVQYTKPYTRTVDFDTDLDMSTDLEALSLEVAQIGMLRNSLPTLVDINGIIKENYESLVSTTLNKFNMVLGTDYKIITNMDDNSKTYSQIENYHKLDSEIDMLIKKQTQDIALEQIARFAELRTKASAYLEENKVPKISYTIGVNINESLEMGDTVHIKHPLCDILAEVLEYEYNVVSEKTKHIAVGNYSRDVKTKFDVIKDNINKVVERVTTQEKVIEAQTNLINSMNKNGLVYIDENEILILDKLPREEAKNVWRFGLRSD